MSVSNIIANFSTNLDVAFLLLNIGYLLNVIALAFREILWIRILLTLGYLLRFITQYKYMSNLDASVWMIIFVIINLIQIISIINERRRRSIDSDILDIYKTVFKSLTSYEFLSFWKKGDVKHSSKGEVIVRKDERLKSIILLLNGRVKVQDGKKIIAYLPRGSFVGEMSFITNENPSADVISEENISYIEWTSEKLFKIKADNNLFWTKIQNILLNDLIIKLKRT
jgi:hypothetical protein